MIREIKNIINRKRIYFLFFLFIAGFGYIIYNLISIQYVYASKYKEHAQYQHMEEFVINAKRGKILDRNGTELALSLQEKTVYANPMLVIDAGMQAKALSGILEIDYYDLKAKLENKQLGFVYIKRQISSETADFISQLNLPGIFIQNENKRYYPQGDIAASIIGFTGLDNTGLYGVELEQEKLLRGIDGKYRVEKDIYGNIIPGNKNDYIEPVNGSDIVLTIDSQIQYIAQKNLEDIVKNYNALRAIAVVMNPVNGEIYAMASYPGFDPNNYQDYDPSLYKNYAISYTYEPGSTFKIVNISSAIDKGSIGIDQEFLLPSSIQVGDKYIKEIFRTYSINYNTSQIIKYSSNVGAVVAALSMGKQHFYDSMKQFGFGSVTGASLPGEEPGFLYQYEKWPSSMIGALAIGQSISVTPLQLVRAACVIANGGYLVKPVITKEIRMANEVIKNPEQTDSLSIISNQAADAVKDMMLECVVDGTGKRAQLENVKVCGKTGTAQKANQNGIGYTEKRVITSFLGFAPYDNPQIAIIVVVDEPHGSNNEIWGGTVAAPVFKNIMSFSLKRLRIQLENNSFEDSDESGETAA